MVEEKYLRRAASALVAAAEYDPPIISGSPFILMTIIAHFPGQPQFQEAYNSLQALPHGHPLRQEFNFSEIKTGYERRSLFGVDDLTRPCGEICLKLNPLLP